MALLTLPAPRTPDPYAAPVVRWGILGTGWIADRFVHALQTHTRQVIQAVGSRTDRILPMPASTPPSSTWRSTSYFGRNAVHIASRHSTPRSCAAAQISRPSSAVIATGFSMSTCLPAPIASSASGRWWLCGVAM